MAEINEIRRLKGTNGTIVVYDTCVKIERKGISAFAIGNFADKTFFYKDITSVNYKKPGLSNGYLQFTVAGSHTAEARNELFKTSTETMNDENTVVLRAFRKSVPKESEEIYQLILKMIESKKGVVT